MAKDLGNGSVAKLGCGVGGTRPQRSSRIRELRGTARPVSAEERLEWRDEGRRFTVEANQVLGRRIEDAALAPMLFWPAVAIRPLAALSSP